MLKVLKAFIFILDVLKASGSFPDVPKLPGSIKGFRLNSYVPKASGIIPDVPKLQVQVLIC